MMSLFLFFYFFNHLQWKHERCTSIMCTYSLGAQRLCKIHYKHFIHEQANFIIWPFRYCITFSLNIQRLMLKTNLSSTCSYFCFCNSHLGSETYQETLIKALAKHFGARILVVDSLPLPSVSCPCVLVFGLQGTTWTLNLKGFNLAI